MKLCIDMKFLLVVPWVINSFANFSLSATPSQSIEKSKSKKIQFQIYLLGSVTCDYITDEWVVNIYTLNGTCSSVHFIATMDYNKGLD